MQSNQALYIAAGFKEDCVNLISEFCDLESSSFEAFSKIWNKMKFSLIFSGRSSRSELMEFCEEVLDITKEFLLSSRLLKEQIGGIYVLYGLYFIMPIKGPKIRMTLREWEAVVNLQSELIHHHQYEGVHILNTLLKNSAFVYCRCEHERGLENYYVLKDFMKGNSKSVLSNKKKNELISIFDNLKQDSKKYVIAKKQLENVIGDSVPRLFDPENIKTMTDTFKNFITQPQKKLTNMELNMSNIVKRPKRRTSKPEPSTSSEALSNDNEDDPLPSTSYVNENSCNIKPEDSGDSESSDDSMDSNY